MFVVKAVSSTTQWKTLRPVAMTKAVSVERKGVKRVFLEMKLERATLCRERWGFDSCNYAPGDVNRW